MANVTWTDIARTGAAILASFFWLVTSAWAASPLIDQDVDTAQIDAPTSPMETAAARPTRFGNISIQNGDGGDRLIVESRAEPVPDIHGNLSLGRVLRFKDTDLVLVVVDTPVATGVNSCPLSYYAVWIDAHSAKHSEVFGKCGNNVRLTLGQSQVIFRTDRESFVISDHDVQQVTLKQSRAEEQQSELDNPIFDQSSVFHPMVKPDMRMYVWCGTLDKVMHTEDGATDVYLAHVGDERFKFAGTVSSNSTKINADQLRIGLRVCMTGRYIANNDTIPILALFAVKPH